MSVITKSQVTTIHPHHIFLLKLPVSYLPHSPATHFSTIFHLFTHFFPFILLLTYYRSTISGLPIHYFYLFYPSYLHLLHFPSILYIWPYIFLFFINMIHFYLFISFAHLLPQYLFTIYLFTISSLILYINLYFNTIYLPPPVLFMYPYSPIPSFYSIHLPIIRSTSFRFIVFTQLAHFFPLPFYSCPQYFPIPSSSSHAASLFRIPPGCFEPRLSLLPTPPRCFEPRPLLLQTLTRCFEPRPAASNPA